MRVFFCFCVLSIRNVVFIEANENWAASLIGYIQQLQPYQVTIFRNSSEVSSLKQNVILQNIIVSLPTVIIDLSDVRLVNQSSCLAMGAFVYPRKTTIYVVLFAQDSYTESFHLPQIRNVMDFLANLSIRTTRPRCLIVYLKTNSVPESLLRPVFQYAWSKKFLDFSVIRERDSNIADLHNYNPFTSSYNCELFTSTTSPFPDKLRDMKGYALKVPHIENAPYMTMKVVNNKVQFSGQGIQLLRYFGKALNYSIDIIVDSSKEKLSTHAPENLNQIILDKVDGLRKNQFEILPIPLYPTTVDVYEEGVEKSLPLVFDEFGVVVSVTAKMEKNEASSAFIYFTLNIASLVVFLIVSYGMKLWQQGFHSFAVLSVSMSQPVKMPSRLSGRIIFLLVIVLSQTYYSNFFAKLTESHVKSYEIPLDTAENVEKSNLKPQISEGLFTLYFEDKDTDEGYHSLKSKLQVIKRDQTCLTEILSNNTRLCFTNNLKARWFIKMHEREDGCPLLRFSKFEFLSIRSSIYFEKGSPYVEKFDKLLRGFIEFGIFEPWAREQDYKNVCSQDKRNLFNDSNHDNLKRQLLLILKYGYVSSSLTFVVEFLFKKMLARKKVVED